MRALSDHGRRLWDAARPLTGPAQAYLESRACRIPPDHGHLRWLPDLRHPSGYAGPALLGLITDAITGRAISLHRTWIRTDGRKAAVEPPRLLLKGCAKAGGVIRLWPECQGQPLAIAEGIETALSLAWAVVPAWACIDAGNLGALPVLRGVSELVIAVDADPAGESAATECAARWRAAGRRARLVRPDAGDGDLNDTARAYAGHE
ncbi:MAG: toprim domain-containing protein [Betaproteobacteria bacterium]|nr:toprim domain-containing protein [Betaproteobacteria bacterium]